MTFELYQRDQVEFSHHGKVLDDVSNDVVTWQLNSKFTLTFDYPMFSKYGDELSAEAIVRVPVPGGKASFRINTIVKSMGLLSVTAYHVFWDLNDDFIADTNIVAKDGNAALQQLLGAAQYSHGFTGASTIGNVATARLVRMSVIAALMGTDDNTFLNRWGGEFDWQDFSFTVNPRLGNNRGVVFEYTRNLTGYTATKDSTAIVTRLLPEGYNGLLLPELYVDSEHINDYLHPKIATKTYENVKAIDDTQTTGTQDDAVPIDEAYEQLRSAAKAEFTDNHIDVASWTYQLNVVLLENTQEFKGLGMISTVMPGDTVTVLHPLDGINVQARLTAYTYQPSSGQYLTQTYDSDSRPDVAMSTTQSQLAAIKSQMQLIDKITIAKAANGSNSVAWGDQSPIDVGMSGKEGDIAFQETAAGTHMWIYYDGAWHDQVDDITGNKVQKQVDGMIGDIAGVKVTASSAATAARQAADSVAMVSLGLTYAQSAAMQAQDAASEAVTTGAKAISNATAALSVASGATLKATSVGASVDSLAGNIQLKADQSVVDGLSKSVSSASAELTVQAGKVALKADSTTVNSLAGTVQTQGTQLAAQAGSLALTVSKSDLTNSLSGYATQAYTQAQVTAASDKIQSTVSAVSAKVDAQQFGTRNYLLDSASYPSPDMPTKPTDSFNVNKDMQLSVDPTYFNGKQIIVSVMVDIDTVTAVGTGNVRAGWEMSLKQADGSTGYAGGWLWLTSADIGKSFHKRVYTVFSPTQYESLITARSYAQRFTANSITVSKPMVALGNVLTDWSPAPEDLTSYTDTQVSTVTQTVTALQATVADKASTSQLTQLSDSLTATIESTTAPNLISDSGWYYNSDPVGGLYTFGLAWYTGSHTLWTLSNPSKTVSVYAKSNQFAVVPGATYTFSMLTELGTNTTKTPALYFLGSKKAPDNPTGTYDNEGILPFGNIPVTSTNVLYYTKTFTVPAGITSGFMRISNDGDTAGSYGGISFVEAQLERGTIATPYRDSVPGMLTEMSAMQGNINLKVSKGDTLSQINIEAGKTLIQSKSIYLDASTVTVGGTAFINAANIKSVNADTITAGTLNAANANVINLNASNITTGTIKGANLSINLNTGEVLFSQGQIKSTDGTLDINVDKRYISTANGDTRVVMRDGGIFLTQPQFLDSSTTPYLEISNAVAGVGFTGGALIGRDNAVLTNSANASGLFGNWSIGVQSFSGVATGKASGVWVPTLVAGADRGVVISGGSNTSYNAVKSSPSIVVGAKNGTDWGGYGNRIIINGDYVHIPSAVIRTDGHAANLYVANDGALVRSTSALKYKTDVVRSDAVTDGLKLIGVPMATWLDKGAIERLKPEGKMPPRAIGVIAEDLAAAGLEMLVERGTDGELEGVQYDRMTAVLLPVIRNLVDRVTQMEGIINAK